MGAKIDSEEIHHRGTESTKVFLGIADTLSGGFGSSRGFSSCKYVHPQATATNRGRISERARARTTAPTTPFPPAGLGSLRVSVVKSFFLRELVGREFYHREHKGFFLG
jgi:hypothetical protein